MIPHLFFYQLVLLGLLWLFFMLHAAWPSQGTATQRRPVEPILPPRKRSSAPKPFPGLTRTPPCAACEQAHAYAPQPPGCPPPRIVPTRGRPRQVDTSQHFCPGPACTYGAYSTPNLPLIPRQTCHPFHTKVATDSMAKLPPNPGESCH